ncbi:hypothetical protein SAMN05443662_1142 [Sulfurivirga caldicuralii]|uniref:Protein FliT n=1 Tax=Sulfurivirga caldicuralii TaxID=364032 RepID=A0A1N6FML0_9GAMM|nr:hypothetical protein [Sulfurivirga caldicuralii]SIN96511.1 hypothetical protein SAMN05443662_1142 [Sulfurivirga caldicuralii]
MSNCYLTCLNLSALMEQAIQKRAWDQLQYLQARWQHEVASCIQTMEAEMERDDVLEKLMRLLEDVQQKTQLLEAAMQALSREHQQQLAGLQKTRTYLRAES